MPASSPDFNLSSYRSKLPLSLSGLDPKDFLLPSVIAIFTVLNLEIGLRSRRYRSKGSIVPFVDMSGCCVCCSDSIPADGSFTELDALQGVSTVVRRRTLDELRWTLLSMTPTWIRHCNMKNLWRALLGLNMWSHFPADVYMSMWLEKSKCPTWLSVTVKP